MPSRSLLLVALAVASVATARAQNWLEVRSSHFTVVSNAGEAEARTAAVQFERMHSVFREVFPESDLNPGNPIVVLAVEDKATFQSLEPESYLSKGQLDITGLFLRTPEKNYVLVWLNAPVAHPIAPVYHEYTHLILSRRGWLPLWLNEGWAEYYQNTQILRDEVRLGMASAENLFLLRRNQLLPLTTVFAVDSNSPYYHEQEKGSIFYAESWALTYYLQIKDREEKTHRLQDYLELVNRKVDAVAAATQAFGDLAKLQAKLQKFIVDGEYGYLRLPAPADADISPFTVRTLSRAQADAARADFYASSNRESSARALLTQVLRDDPGNISARETLGSIAFRQQSYDEARKWYEEAVQLGSQSFLAYYSLAAVALNKKLPDMQARADVENYLQTAIKLNPLFAPAYECMGSLLAVRGRNFEEAHQWLLKAIQLDPGNADFRLNDARILLRMNRANDAAAALEAALNMAHTPEQTAAIQDALQRTPGYVALRGAPPHH